MSSWNGVGQFVPGQRRQQAQGRPACLRRDLDQVVVDWVSVGTPVESVPDPFDRICRLQTFKRAS